ncbi:MAG: class II glutamine amidotransferase [Ignavibacteria bacterium]
MCRWLAYTGSPIWMSKILIEPKDSLIDQSLHARKGIPTNGDGFGIGWYDRNNSAGLFRSLRPAWNDPNLKDLVSHIGSHLFLAHIRAASLAPIQETNCHPFRYKNILFVHNGQINNFDKIHQKLISLISPEYFGNIQGSTDTEIMFHLALSFGLEKDVPSSISKMVQAINSAGKEAGVSCDLTMTLGISDGNSLWGFRYANDGNSPSLFISPGIEDLIRLNPSLNGKLNNFAASLVSEPIGKYQEIWKPVPGNTVVLIKDEKINYAPFQVNN